MIVARDPETREILLMFDPPEPPSAELNKVNEVDSERGNQGGDGPFAPIAGAPDIPEGAEVVEIPEKSIEEALNEMWRKVGKRPGRMWLRDEGELEADPPEESPADLLEELELTRTKSGKKPSDPLTWGDIVAAAEARKTRRSRQRREGER